MLRIVTVCNLMGLGVLVTSGRCPGLQPSSDLRHLPNAISRKIRSDFLDSRFLPRQWGLLPRASVGAQRRVRCGPSSGGMTPAGAIKPGTQHAAKRPTDDDGVHLQRLETTPAFALLSP